MNFTRTDRAGLLTKLAALDAQVIERLAPISLAFILLYAACLAIGNGPGNVLLAILGGSALPIAILRPELRSRPILIFSFLVILYVLAMAIRADIQGASGRHLSAIDNYIFFAYAPFIAIHVAIALRYRITFERLCLLVIAILVITSTYGAGEAPDSAGTMTGRPQPWSPRQTCSLTATGSGSTGGVRASMIARAVT